MSKCLEYEVDGSVIQTADENMDGREVRSSANLIPPSSFVLIRTDRGLAASLGLEERVEFREGDRPVFRSFEADHLNMLTVDERGWEWGADSIAEQDIRLIGRIPEDHDLFLDSDGDRPIPRGGYVNLANGGVERVRSRKARPALIGIIVNGRPREVKPGKISFEELIGLAFPTPPTGPNVSFTVSYRKGPPAHPEGSILPGQSVHVIEGMTFNVSATDKS